MASGKKEIEDLSRGDGVPEEKRKKFQTKAATANKKKPTDQTLENPCAHHCPIGSGGKERSRPHEPLQKSIRGNSNAL